VADAYASFKTVRAESSDSILDDEMAIRAEFELLRRQLVHERQESVTFVDMFKQPSRRKRCIIGWLTMFGAQGTATLVINSKSFDTKCTRPAANVSFADYGPLLYSNLGFNTVQQLLIQSGWISVCPFGNWINALVVDKFGRTRMLRPLSERCAASDRAGRLPQPGMVCRTRGKLKYVELCSIGRVSRFH
jgi:hypothetical protein